MSEKRELKKLVRRVQSGDLEAYGALYDRFFDSVYGYVLRQVREPADAEDIVSGVFLEVLEKIDGFTWRGAGFAAWLFRIARNDVLDHFRRRGNRSRETELTVGIDAVPAAELVESLAERSWDEQELRTAITRLSEEQQQVILLKLMLNFSNRQIGDVLDKSEGAVKALRHRAMFSLRQILTEAQGK
ncbi:MAG: RNA polymerase sigma factor [Thermoleophilia bacterium]